MGNYSLKNYYTLRKPGRESSWPWQEHAFKPSFREKMLTIARMKTLTLFCLLALSTLAADTTILANSLVFMTATR